VSESRQVTDDRAASPFGPEDLRRVEQLTRAETIDIALRHAELNQGYVRTGRSLRDLLKSSPAPAPSTLVFGPGPSNHRRNPAAVLLEARYAGPIIASDGALGYLLRRGVVPQYVVSVDPHPTRLVRWYGDPELASRRADDYFQRQDIDIDWQGDEQAVNQDLIALVNRQGPGIKALLSTSVAPAVARRCLEAGMAVYWWNPMMDAGEGPASLNARLQELNPVPCIATGGCTATAALVMAVQIFRPRRIGLLGFDFGYYPDVCMDHTQYYDALRVRFPRDYERYFARLVNPDLGEAYLTDVSHYCLRTALLELLDLMPCPVYNCTSGGILFGKGITTLPLKDFLGLA